MDEVEFGRYRLLGLIGEGGMGQVFRARDTEIGRHVAIKVLPTDLASQPGYRERFRREAHTAAQLTEPHVIPIFDTGEIDGRLYLVMPIIDGIDVASLLNRDGPMRPQLAVRVIGQLASALDAAHAQGLVHRDVKPSNALITGTAGREFVYLIDFGITHDSAATKLTRTGSILGTLAYMAPERFTSGKADARADIYALGCVLHECLTGSQPFPGDSMEQQVAGHLTVDPPRPSGLRPGIPTGFDDVIARAMAKNPDDRYQNAQDLVEAAEQVLTQPIPASLTMRQPAHPTWPPTHASTAAPPTLDANAQPPTQLAGPHQPAKPSAAPTSPRRRNLVPASTGIGVGVALVAVGFSVGINLLFTLGALVTIVAVVVLLFTLARPPG
jgi:serine/threonine protein kinase